MKTLPSRLRRLDGALAELPLDEPMLLSELDGFLTGILLSPEPIAQAEWMTVIWGTDEGGVPVFDDPLDVRWFADAVAARQAEIARDLARGKPQPIFDVDERNGDVLWEIWMEGFDAAIALRPGAWTMYEDAAPEAWARLSLLVAVARHESPLDSVEINAMQDRAPGDLIDAIVRLQAARAGARPAPALMPAAKVGRNDPCPCGSGRKSKRCCG